MEGVWGTWGAQHSTRRPEASAWAFLPFSSASVGARQWQGEKPNSFYVNQQLKRRKSEFEWGRRAREGVEGEGSFGGRLQALGGRTYLVGGVHGLTRALM